MGRCVGGDRRTGTGITQALSSQACVWGCPRAPQPGSGSGWPWLFIYRGGSQYSRGNKDVTKGGYEPGGSWPVQVLPMWLPPTPRLLLPLGQVVTRSYWEFGSVLKERLCFRVQKGLFCYYSGFKNELYSLKLQSQRPISFQRKTIIYKSSKC